MTGRRITPTGVLVAPTSLEDTDKQEWLSLRRTGIGGSDVAAILGMDPYTSPYQLWLDKRGELPDLPRNARLERAAQWGHLHEPLIAKEFAAQTGLRTRRIGMIAHVDEPWRRADLDRQVFGCPDGPCLLEIKNRSAYKAKDWGPTGGDGVPDREALQTHWYLTVTGYRHAHVAVLLNGNDDRYYRLAFDNEMAADILSLAGEFWRGVVDGVPPAPSASQAEADLLDHLSGGDGGTRVLDPAVAREWMSERRRLAATIAECQEWQRELDNRIRRVLGDAEAGVVDGVEVVTWRPTGTFAAKRFRDTHPDLAREYEHLVPAIDRTRLQADHPDLYRSFRARPLRMTGASL